MHSSKMECLKSPAAADVKKFILNNTESLSECIDVKNGLLDKLLSRGILTRKQYTTVAGKPTKEASLTIGFITDALDDVDLLLAVLDETQHKHVANFVRGMGKRRPEFGDDWPLSREERQLLDDKQSELVELIDSMNGLLDKMLSTNCITARQRDRYVKSVVVVERNDLLLKRVRCSSAAVFEQFLRCLKDTKQHHVVSLLKPELVQDVRPLNAEEQFCITSNSDELADQLEITDRLLIELEATDCITRRQRQFLQSVPPLDRCQDLLDMIRRGSQKDFQSFLGSLEKTEQAHLSDLLRNQIQQKRNVIQNIKKLRDRLLMIIDVEHGLLDELRSLNVLTEQQVEDIQGKPTKSSVNLLLDYIIGMSNSEQCERFLFALEETHQEHVANFIRSNGIPTYPPNNWPLLDSKSWILSGNHQTLLELIDTTNGLLDELVSAECISSRHAERIAACRTVSSMNSTFWRVMQRGSIADYDELIDCLLKTKQYVVAAMLAPDHAGIVPPLSQENDEKLVRKNAILIRLIVTKNGLTQEMFDADCITERQKSYIESAVSHSESNTRLLHVLRRGSQADFDKFLECLEITSQQHVNNILTSRLYSAIDFKTRMLEPDLSPVKAHRFTGRRAQSEVVRS